MAVAEGVDVTSQYNLRDKTTDEVISINTKRRHRPQRQYDIAGQIHGNVCSQTRHGDVSGRSADAIYSLFLSKPVVHRRPLNFRTQDPVDLYNLKKIALSQQAKRTLSPQEQNSFGIREIRGFCHPSKYLLELHREEMHMARSIHTKELMLHEKLSRVEEKIRQKLQRDSVITATGDDQKHKEEGHNRADWPQITLSMQQRKKKGREDVMQERKQEDFNHLRLKQSQKFEDRMRKVYEDEKGSWGKLEMEFTESPQLKMKGNKGTHYVTVNKQTVGGEVNKLRWPSVKDDTKMQGNAKHNSSGKEAGLRTEDRIKKTKERELNEACIGNIGLTRENKHMEKTFKQLFVSDNEQEMSQMTQHKTAHSLATESHRREEGKIFKESTLPPVSNLSYSSRPQQGELGLADSADASFHLLPCRFCRRKFDSGRLEKHVKICAKVNQLHRQVFNSYINRTKGSAIEEFWKTHSRSKTPENLQKKNQEPNHKAYSKSLLQSRLPAVTSKAGSRVQQSKQIPRLPSPWTLPPALPVESQGVPRPAEKHSPSGSSPGDIP